MPDYGHISEDQTPEQIAAQVEAADPYPEHTKLKAISEKSQAIGEFLDIFLPAQGIALCEQEDGHFWPTFKSIDRLLAAYFEIDQKKIDDEKRQMLAEMRAANS